MVSIDTSDVIVVVVVVVVLLVRCSVQREEGRGGVRVDFPAGSLWSITERSPMITLFQRDLVCVIY